MMFEILLEGNTELVSSLIESGVVDARMAMQALEIMLHYYGDLERVVEILKSLGPEKLAELMAIDGPEGFEIDEWVNLLKDIGDGSLINAIIEKLEKIDPEKAEQIRGQLFDIDLEKIWEGIENSEHGPMIIPTPTYDYQGGVEDLFGQW